MIGKSPEDDKKPGAVGSNGAMAGKR
jgi:hypothetical protein